MDSTQIMDAKFDVVIRTADLCNRMKEQISEIEQISLPNDQLVSDLIDNSTMLLTNLESTQLRGDNYKDLHRHLDQLESIVYLPSRLASCINYPEKYHEAITLLENANKLNELYSEEVPLVQTVYKQAEDLRQNLINDMSNELDEQKESSIDALKFLIHQLARCGSYSGRELRLRFLEARDHWFNNECEAKSDTFDELILFFCRGLPKIFEEYRSIFGENTIPANSLLVARSRMTNTMGDDGAIINSWLLLKTSTFILSLELHLKSLEQSRILTPTMLGDTMQECFKLTNWLTTIGFDFSSQLRPLFSKAVIEEVRHSIEEATSRFETGFTKIILQSIESLLLPIDDNILRISNNKPEEQVPESIRHYPIFKIYCMYLIDSMRWIQSTRSLLSPISLCLDVYAALNASLSRTMKALAVVLNTDNNSNHPILSKIAISFLTEILPFISNYCELIFPEKVVLSALGISKVEFKSLCTSDPDKMRNFRLDLHQIAYPIKSVMPSLMQAIEG